MVNIQRLDPLVGNTHERTVNIKFAGRVVRGKRKKRWLAEVLKQAGEKADYIEAFD